VSFVSALRADPLDPTLVFSYERLCPFPRAPFPPPPFPAGKNDDLWLTMLACMADLECLNNDEFKYHLLCHFVTTGHMSSDLALRIYNGANAMDDSE
jgi:hypothetical protein